MLHIPRLRVRARRAKPHDPHATITTLPSSVREAGPELPARTHRLTLLGDDERAVRQRLLIRRGEFSAAAMDWGTA
ncbi:hypothetical protein [Streptomyces sp. NPDC058861]|uniref:hypothetical protein n=1 Tax=Streptomyces sp. NPDC058861 TaxID=3346653 RepID=UPI00368CB6EE